jgi:excisionase family DNA binding protein
VIFPLSALPAGWLTIDQAAAYFGVSRATVERQVYAGEWPIVLPPGDASRPRFSPENIVAIEQAAATTAVRSA